MIASRRIQIDLLYHRKIRLERCHKRTCSLHSILHTLFALRPGGFPSVHEKAKIRRICTKANIVRQCRIFRSDRKCVRSRSFLCRLFYSKWQIVLNPVIGGKQINHIRRHDPHQNRHHNSKYLQTFFYHSLHHPISSVIFHVCLKHTFCKNRDRKFVEMLFQTCSSITYCNYWLQSNSAPFCGGNVLFRTHLTLCMESSMMLSQKKFESERPHYDKIRTAGSPEAGSLQRRI